ncbi:hypothetical protein FRX31_023233 [Thalictrum thalictroides]|uniref:Uncharacterized protein n=1 Tax=Thalictrum thalictroides TaxID=46969 RepID=A0A7J6VS39_THATH|nr:hypothetical protein FRX31_023233 [Thalictrum thalictroides]
MCNHCKTVGHLVTECKKLQRVMAAKEKDKTQIQDANKSKKKSDLPAQISSSFVPKPTTKAPVDNLAGNRFKTLASIIEEQGIFSPLFPSENVSLPSLSCTNQSSASIIPSKTSNAKPSLVVSSVPLKPPPSSSVNATSSTSAPAVRATSSTPFATIPIPSSAPLTLSSPLSPSPSSSFSFSASFSSSSSLASPLPFPPTVFTQPPISSSSSSPVAFTTSSPLTPKLQEFSPLVLSSQSDVVPETPFVGSRPIPSDNIEASYVLSLVKQNVKLPWSESVEIEKKRKGSSLSHVKALARSQAPSKTGADATSK